MGTETEEYIASYPGSTVFVPLCNNSQRARNLFESYKHHKGEEGILYVNEPFQVLQHTCSVCRMSVSPKCLHVTRESRVKRDPHMTTLATTN